MTLPNNARPLRVLIVDDERLPRDRLKRLLEEIPHTVCVGECANGRSAVDAIESLRPDLVLLDVRMPGMGGIEVARALTGHVPFIIFVTAFDEYALSAFEVHAIDYLLKPVERERFVDAIERARTLVLSTTAAQRHERLLALLQGEPRLGTPDADPRDTRDPLGEGAAPAPPGDPAAFPRRFLVKGDGQMYFVAVDDIRSDAIERARTLVLSTTAAQRHERLLALLQGEPRLGTPDADPRDTRDPLGEGAAPAPPGDPAAFPRRFLVKGDGQMYFVAVDDI